MKSETTSNDEMIHVRCHPNYQSSGKGWYDKAYIRFEDSDEESFTDYPSKSLSCIPRHRDGKDTFTSSSNALAKPHSTHPSSQQSGLSSPTLLLRHPQLSPCALSFPTHQMGQRSLLSGTDSIGHNNFVMLLMFSMTRIENTSTKLFGFVRLLVLLHLLWDPAMKSRLEPLITHPTPKLHPLTFTSILRWWK
jgi:hypothetical protein